MGVQVVAVGMGSPGEAARFKRSRNIPFPLLSDTRQAVYDNYGLTHLNPAIELQTGAAASLMLEAIRGNFAGMPVGDITQLGGTFLVDKEGITRYAHRDRGTSTYPTIQELLTAIKQAELTS